MRTLSSWATRLALSAGATAGIVAACYNDVPGPSGPMPLPPTREVPPQGPRPGPITPTPITPAPTPITPTPSAPTPLDAGPASTSRVLDSRMTEMNALFAGAQEGDEDEDIDDDEDIDGGEDDDDNEDDDNDVLDAGIDGGADAGEDGLDPVDAAVSDAGVAAVIDLPPLPDTEVPIEPPGLPH